MLNDREQQYLFLLTDEFKYAEPTCEMFGEVSYILVGPLLQLQTCVVFDQVDSEDDDVIIEGRGKVVLHQH